MQEQLQTIIASYFRYWGAEVAEMLSKVGDYTRQRAVVRKFMHIIEDELWIEKNNGVVITEEIEDEIKQPVSLFVSLYYLDKMAQECITKTFEIFNKE